MEATASASCAFDGGHIQEAVLSEAMNPDTYNCNTMFADCSVQIIQII